MSRDSVLFTRDAFQRNPDGYVWLLDDCGLLKRIENDDQRAIHNWGVNLLENAGAGMPLNRYGVLHAILNTILAGDIPDEDRRDDGRQRRD